MLGLAVLLLAFAILATVVLTECPRSPRGARSAWRVIAFVVALGGFALFLFGIVLIGIMIFSAPPFRPEGHFTTFLAGTLASVVGGAILGVIVLPSRTVFGRRAALLATAALVIAIVVLAAFVTQRMPWWIR